jgi:hypothetical protein
MSGRGTASD